MIFNAIHKSLYGLSVLIIFMLFFMGCQKEEIYTASDVIVMLNSNSAINSKNTERLLQYLDHFGVRYYTMDIAGGEVPSEADCYSLAIISHPEIDGGDDHLSLKLEHFLERCRSMETGILSFDPLMPDWLLNRTGNDYKEDKNVGSLRFSSENHYITGFHQLGEKKELFGYMSIPKLSVKEGEAVLTGNDLPLLVVSDKEKGRVVQWTSQDWMYSSVLGPLGGLDDCLWKSIVWAARKPFVMQALPPIATMRVNNVVGCDRQQWDETPFHWVKTVNKYGFKPWLGLFIYNITPEGIEELKKLTNNGLATVSPQALGRPPRSALSKWIHFIPDYYYPDAIPNLSDHYDEFIFFDHNNRKPWPDETADKTLQAVDDWYSEVGPLPMSNYLVPHWGEIGSNTIAHIYDKWNIEFILSGKLNKSYFDEYYLTKSIRRGPFYLSDEPVIGKPKEVASKYRSFYTADFVNLAGRNFFGFISQICNDSSGYDLKPNNDVEATASRGIESLSLGLEGKSLAVLFTHETDYIFRVKPENWDKIFGKISDGISKYNPNYINHDEALKVVRALHSSEIQNCEYNVSTGEVTIKMTGETDVPTSVFVYTDNDKTINEELVEIPVFQNEVSQAFKLLK